MPEALEELRRRGWNLAILSNTDRDLIAASQRQLGVPVDVAVVAEEVRSLQAGARALGAVLRADDRRSRPPRPRRSEPLPRRRACDASSGLKVVWINRLGEVADPEPDRELPDLSGLPDALDELVPAPA